jgi:hypothetical protein
MENNSLNAKRSRKAKAQPDNNGENIRDTVLRAAVSQGDKWGFIDENGNAAVECVYDWAWNFSEGFAAVGKDGKLGYVDISAIRGSCEYDRKTTFRGHGRCKT